MSVKPTGLRRYRCITFTHGGFGRSLPAEIAVLELEETNTDTGEASWRCATYSDLTEEPPK